MVENGAMARRHLTRAKDGKVFTAQNLKDLRWLRDRVSWNHAFAEDRLMEGMLLARHSRKVAAQVKAEAAAESKLEAKKAMEQGRQEEAVRTLIGPRGGLPHLRPDLVKLAHLLHLEVGDRDTIEILKKKIRPMLAIMQFKGDAKPQSSETGAPSTPAPKTTTPRSGVGAYQASPGGASSAAPELVTQETLARLMVDQEQRFQSMLQQTMMSMWQMNPQSFLLQQDGSMNDSVLSWGDTPEDDQQMEAAQR